MELAEVIWTIHHGPTKRFHFISDEPFKYDVQKRVPDVSKAKEILGFEATTSLEESVLEVYNHMKAQHVNH